MIDTHAHLNFQAFKNDWAEVVERSLIQGVEAIINIGSNFATSEQAIKIARKFSAEGPLRSREDEASGSASGGKDCWAAIGLHPIHVKDEKFAPEKYAALIRENKEAVKAIGETGLDYFHGSENKDDQKKVFLKHLDLAKDFDLPVILHCRGSQGKPKDAYQDLLLVISHLRGVPQGVIHCFSTDWPIAEQFLNLGFYIGFTGPITFRNASSEVLEVVKNMPLDRILVETDCPFLAPEPFRGQRNEPMYVRYMIEKIAELKKSSFEEIDKITSDNARTLFGL